MTMTFNDEEYNKLRKEIESIHKADEYEIDNQIATLAVRRFLERHRKKYGKSIKHWFVTELGSKNTERIHIHGLLWTNLSKDELKIVWKYGFLDTGEYVNERSVAYICKYVSKKDEKHKEYNSIILCSKGIGKGYLDRTDWKNNKYNGNKTIETYTNRQGYKTALPIYYRNKVYTEEEREQLWLNKLDQETRYILGQKIDVSKNEIDYYKSLEEARRINSTLGYGNDSINWERRKYENERRKINKLNKLSGNR